MLPHLDSAYFSDIDKRVIYQIIRKYIGKYRTLPTVSALKVEVNALDNVNEHTFKEINISLDKLAEMKDEWDLDWLVDKSEEFCKECALHNAILASVEKLERKENVSDIPELVKKALQVEFNTNVGLEFLDDKDIDLRWEKYHENIAKIPTGITKIDNCCGGGIEKKALSIIMGPTNSGKTAAFISLTSNMLRDGQNVLYITLEMAEEKIIQRYEANFLDVDINDVPLLKEEKYKSSLQNIKVKSCGRLVVREFPTSTANVNHIRALLDELKIKKEFVPDVIVIDYLNLMNSCRITSDNMYSVVKAIAEEVRGLAVEGDYAIVSGTQSNRCLTLDTVVEEENKGKIAIIDLEVGDRIKGDNGFVDVLHKFPIEKQKTFKVTLECGKEIICSARHLFPTTNGEMSLEMGMCVGDELIVE